MAYILQKAVGINTGAGGSATATFSNPLSGGTALVIALMAIDTGAAVGTDGNGTSNVSLTDTLGLQANFTTVGDAIPHLVGDRTNGYSYLTGLYYLLPVRNPSGGAEAITFQFTPVSSAAKCQVGLVAYEVFDGQGGGDTTFSPTPIDATVPVCSNLIGGITLNAPAMYIVCGACVTPDGSQINGGGTTSSPPAGTYTLDGVDGATINGVHTSMAVQSFLTNISNLSNPNDVAFGNSPAAVLSSAGSGLGFALNSAPASTFFISGNCGTPGATISYAGTSSGSVQSDVNGNYSIDGLSNGSYTVIPTKTSVTFDPVSQAETINGGYLQAVNFTISAPTPPSGTAWSPVDSRVSKPNSATFRLVQGAQIDDVQTSSNHAVPGKDCRVKKPVDCRVNKPQNSRTAPPFKS